MSINESALDYGSTPDGRAIARPTLPKDFS